MAVSKGKARTLRMANTGEQTASKESWGGYSLQRKKTDILCSKKADASELEGKAVGEIEGKEAGKKRP